LYGLGRGSTGSGDSESSEPQYIDDRSECSLPLLGGEAMAEMPALAASFQRLTKHEIDSEVGTMLNFACGHA